MYEDPNASTIHSQQLYVQVWTNVFSGTIEISGLLPETSGVAPSSPVYQFSHAVDDAPETGIWCSPSSITTPALASSLGWFYEAVMDWLEEKVKSKSNIDALAKYGANMDHPCVRMFTKEEVDANRNFLWVSASIWTKLEPLKVCFNLVSIPYLTFSYRKRHRRVYKVAQSGSKCAERMLTIRRPSWPP